MAQANEANLACPHCPSNCLKRFNKRGLAIHYGRMHKPKASPPEASTPAPQPSPTAATLGRSLTPGDLTTTHPPAALTQFETLGDQRACVRVLKHIPKGARSRAAGKLTSVIDKCLESNLAEDWWDLLSFNYTSLRVPQGKEGTTSLTSRVKQNIGSRDCVDDVPDRVSRSPASVYKIIEGKVYDGDLRGNGEAPHLHLQPGTFQ